MIPYFFVCALLVLAGCGLLRLFSISANRVKAPLLLAPSLTFVFLTICLGASIPLGIPVRQSWWLIFLLTTGLAGLGIPLLKQQLQKRMFFLLFILLLLPLMLFLYLLLRLQQYLEV